jgi:formylglycine-generating enzyme
VDRFSHLVIYTTLRALVVGGRELWDRFYNGDRLLLGPDDFRDPENSEGFRALWKIDDPDVQVLTGHLGLAATEPIERVPLLSELVTDSGIVPLTTEQQARASAMLGLAVGGKADSLSTADPGETLDEASSANAAAPPMAPVVRVADGGRDGDPIVEIVPKIVERDIVPAQAATGRRSLRERIGGLISGTDQILLRVVGDENTVVHNFLRVVFPLCLLVGMGFTAFAVPTMIAALRGSVQMVEDDRATESGDARSEVSSPTANRETSQRQPPAEAKESSVAEPPKPDSSIPALAIAPFDAETARGHQQAWASHLGVPVEIENSIGMKLVLIPPGEFMMGAPETEATAREDEKPQHRVRITRPFYLGVTEVTQGQWQAVIDRQPWEGKKAFRVGSEYAVSWISWADTSEFCRSLNTIEADFYRLPTEAEWEFACRAGTETRYCFGDDSSRLTEYAWFKENAEHAGEGYPHQVGLKRANAWNLFDMHGNVWEWCQDYYGADYYQDSPLEDPTGPTSGRRRVCRGGCWCAPSNGSCTSAHRTFWQGFLRDVNGFRVAMDLGRTPASRLDDRAQASMTDAIPLPDEATEEDLDMGPAVRHGASITTKPSDLAERERGSRPRGKNTPPSPPNRLSSAM